MKTSILLLFLFAMIYLNAQNYLIDFTGFGTSNIVDSVKVENLARGTTLTLGGGDILNLVATTGINTHTRNESSLTIYPNPMYESSEIAFYSGSKDLSIIEIYNIEGKRIISQEQQINHGRNVFEIAGLSTGVYFARVSTTVWRSTINFVSLQHKNAIPAIKFKNEISGDVNADAAFKSTSTLVTMDYNEGERILFKGFSVRDARVITLIPIQSQTVDFEFITCEDGGKNNYAVVTIGTQTWMAENLRTTKYNDGSPIMKAVSDSAWESNISGAYCWYDDDSAAYSSSYGALYNWYAVSMNSNGFRNLCPDGWHVPSNEEWLVLKDYLISNGYNFNGSTKDNKIAKSLAAITSWNSSANEGSIGNKDYPAYRNKTGFTALPGGSRSCVGSCYNSGSNSYWWSATENSSINSLYWNLQYEYSDISNSDFEKLNGFSVRCIKE